MTADTITAIKKALEAAEQFIVNGVELGYIRMPEPGTPDSAHQTVPMIRQAQTALESLQRGKREDWSFAHGDLVRKKSGSWWEGRVVGTYSTEQTPRGYAVQLDKPNGPVQIYPESSLESALRSEER